MKMPSANTVAALAAIGFLIVLFVLSWRGG